MVPLPLACSVHDTHANPWIERRKLIPASSEDTWTRKSSSLVEQMISGATGLFPGWLKSNSWLQHYAGVHLYTWLCSIHSVMQTNSAVWRRLHGDQTSNLLELYFVNCHFLPLTPAVFLSRKTNSDVKFSRLSTRVLHRKILTILSGFLKHEMTLLSRHLTFGPAGAAQRDP